MTNPTRAQIEALVREYRTTMDNDVLHSWASDAIKMLRAMTTAEPQPAPVEPVGNLIDREDVIGAVEAQWRGTLMRIGGQNFRVAQMGEIITAIRGIPTRAAQTAPPEDVAEARGHLHDLMCVPDDADGEAVRRIAGAAYAALANQGGA